MVNSDQFRNAIFDGIPSDTPSLRAAYHYWCEAQTPLGNVRPVEAQIPSKVGIIGGGMAGLYAALIFKTVGVPFHIFEAEPVRVGGRVDTHRFTGDPNQYFEAGAMRLPHIPAQQPVFDLIDFLNANLPASEQVELIPYVLQEEDANLVFVNRTYQKDGSVMTLEYANKYPDELGFPLEPADRGKTAKTLLDNEIQPFLDAIEKDFDTGFLALIQYDDYSMRSYLAQVGGWYEEKINYVEVMMSGTNQFQNSFTELVIESMDFAGAKWSTIKDGMDRLPNAIVKIIGAKNITMGASVYKIEEVDGGIAVHHTGSPNPETFGAVIAAVPPAVLRMWETPAWPPAETHAIRALHFEPLYKIGMRFKTRFWEKFSPPSYGGQSITDLPSRWYVYPSYGLHDAGPGVLLLYGWMTDAYRWLPLSDAEQVRIALRDLATVYGPAVIEDEYIEAYAVSWPEKWPQGDAMFFPGQFKNLFNIARAPQGSVYFAGEHLSVHHTWIVGAIDSATLACQQLLGGQSLPTFGGQGPTTLGGKSTIKLVPHTYNYSNIVVPMA